MRALVTLLLACFFTASVAHAAPDYAPGSSEWNGLLELVQLAQKQGCAIVAGDELDWSALKKTDVLWFVYPRASVEPGKLSRFLGAGGRAVVADDFGAAGPALKEALRLSRGGVPVAARDIERYHDNPNLLVAHSQLGTPLGRSTESLVSNHPTAFQAGGLPVAFGFGRGDALVVEEHFQGGGYAVAIADPSVLINNMLELDGNRAFAAALVAETCRAGDEIHLFTQAFTQHGDPPAAFDDVDPGSSPAKFNDVVDKFNQQARTAVGVRRATILLGLAAGLVASFLLLGAFPARGLIRDRWTKAGRLAEGALSPSEMEWDLAGPLGILRAEVTDRLAAALGSPIDFAWQGPSALAERVGARFGPVAARHAGELWRLLKRIRWRDVDGDLVPDERIGRRQLGRAHALATALFDEVQRS